MKVSVDDIKKLREQTGAGVADCRRALEEAGGDSQKALKLLRDWGMEKADKKAERTVSAGWVFSYIHHNGKVGAILTLACETDFVAKTDDFQHLGRELAMQAVASNATSPQELLETQYMRDPSKTVHELVKETIGKLGENIQIVDFKVVRV